MKQKKFQLIGHKLCPYVQRVVILLEEKQIPYLRTDIELENKPAWLEEISPTGKVPVLVVDNKDALLESNVICEYLDEVSPDSLLPDNAFEKTTHRSWITFGTEMLSTIAQIIYQDQNHQELSSSLATIKNRLGILENELAGNTFFSGENFHLIDAVYATLFRFFTIIGAKRIG